ncbi:MAG: oligosaccharide flippase family protein [Candidatus Omnitrophota bacterium]
MQDSIREKAISSLFGSYFAQFAQIGIRLFLSILLARILLPKDFGLFAIAFMILNIAKIVMQLGLGQHIIREDKVNYAALFSLECAAGFFVFILLQIINPYLAVYNIALPSVNRVLSFALIPYCLSIVPTVYGYKELKLREMIIPNLLHGVSFSVGAILLALKGLGVWALVYSHLISEAVFAYACWKTVGRFTPISFRFKLKEVFMFVLGARYFYIIALFGIFAANADKMLLGKLVSLQDIGYYSVAATLSMYVVNLIEPSLNNVFYPIFSKIKADISKTKEFYASATIVLYWFEIPIYLFLVFNADIVIRLMLGLKWLPAVSIFRVLAVIPIINPCWTFGFQIIQAHSKEKIQFYFNVLYFVLLVPIGYFAIMRWGVMGIAYTQLLLQGVIYVLLYFANKITRNVLSVWLSLLPIYLVGLVGFALIYILFKIRYFAFLASLLYTAMIYIFFYNKNIKKIVKEKFADVAIFKRLRIV